MLGEYCAKRQLDVVYEGTDDKDDFGFMWEVWIQDRHYAKCYGRTKKDAKRDCADAAMKILLQEDNPDKIKPNMTHYDKMSNLAHAAYSKLVLTVRREGAGGVHC